MAIHGETTLEKIVAIIILDKLYYIYVGNILTPFLNIQNSFFRIYIMYRIEYTSNDYVTYLILDI